MARKKQTDNQFSFDDYQLKILNASDAVDVMRDVLKELDREWVCVVNLDNHLKPVNFNVVFIGSINLSLAPVQNILKSGLLSNCNCLILLHNHPSGELTPSDEDNQLTKRVTEAAKLLEMEVLDHVIVGGQTGEIYSFRQGHPELFSMENIDLDYIHQVENAADRGLAEGKATYQAKGKYDPKQATSRRSWSRASRIFSAVRSTRSSSTPWQNSPSTPITTISSLCCRSRMQRSASPTPDGRRWGAL